jgi:16S rRNA processing protein RimM
MGEVQDRDAGDGELVDEPVDGAASSRLPPLDPAALVEVLEFLARSLVEAPDKVRVESVERDGGVTLRLFVDQPDMGKVIGRAGRTARALRTLMRAAGVRAGVGTHVEMSSSSDFVAVGRVTRAHGVRGEVSVFVLTEIEERFEAGSTLRLEDGRPLTVRASRPNRGRTLVRFEEVPDRTAAEALRGAYLFVPASEVPAAPEDAFWPHDLEGCEVLIEGRGAIGTISEVIHGPANDVWVAIDGDRETLVPALRDVVVSVDVGARRVVIHDVPGLTD